MLMRDVRRRTTFYYDTLEGKKKERPRERSHSLTGRDGVPSFVRTYQRGRENPGVYGTERRESTEVWE